MFDKLFDLWFTYHAPTPEQAEAYTELESGQFDLQDKLRSAIIDTDARTIFERHDLVNASCRAYAERIVAKAEALASLAVSRGSLMGLPGGPGILLGISGYNFQDDVHQAFRHLRMARMLANLGIRAEEGQGRYLAMAATEVEKARLCANSALALGGECLDMNTRVG